MKWLVLLSWPHSWRNEEVYNFGDEASAREWATPRASGKIGMENYTRILLAHVVEELN